MTNGIFFIIITEYCNAAITCNGQGTCQESGDCQCKPNYYGSECSSKLSITKKENYHTIFVFLGAAPRSDTQCQALLVQNNMKST